MLKTWTPEIAAEAEKMLREIIASPKTARRDRAKAERLLARIVAGGAR